MPCGAEKEVTAVLKQRLIALVADTAKVPPERVSLESSLAELGIDSLQGLNLLFAIENEFNLNIPDPYALKVRSVGELAQGIEKLLAEGVASPAS
jgi:acyl carrier protein